MPGLLVTRFQLCQSFSAGIPLPLQHRWNCPPLLTEGYPNNDGTFGSNEKSNLDGYLTVKLVAAATQVNTM
jgi:hypothetical protein